MPARTIKTWPLNWALIRYQPWPFAVHSILLILVTVAPVGLGLVAQAVFDTITGAAPAALGVWRWSRCTSRLGWRSWRSRSARFGAM